MLLSTNLHFISYVDDTTYNFRCNKYTNDKDKIHYFFLIIFLSNHSNKFNAKVVHEKEEEARGNRLFA